MARGCLRRVTVGFSLRGEQAMVALWVHGFLEHAPSGSSTWIWKAGGLMEDFSPKLPCSSDLHAVIWGPETWKQKTGLECWGKTVPYTIGSYRPFLQYLPYLTFQFEKSQLHAKYLLNALWCGISIQMYNTILMSESVWRFKVAALTWIFFFF